MAKPKSLNAIYSDLKRAYFPGWDKENNWRIRTRSGLENIWATGSCDYDTRTIDVVPAGFETVDQLRAARFVMQSLP